jgi:hypothetical protein
MRMINCLTGAAVLFILITMIKSAMSDRLFMVPVLAALIVLVFWNRRQYKRTFDHG